MLVFGPLTVPCPHVLLSPILHVLCRVCFPSKGKPSFVSFLEPKMMFMDCRLYVKANSIRYFSREKIEMWLGHSIEGDLDAFCIEKQHL